MSFRIKDGLTQGTRAIIDANKNFTGSSYSISTTYPTINPNLHQDFCKDYLDPRMTFTRATTATYIDANGNTQTAAINEPRFNHVNGVCKGLLIESGDFLTFSTAPFSSNDSTYYVKFYNNTSGTTRTILNCGRFNLSITDSNVLQFVVYDGNSTPHTINTGGTAISTGDYQVAFTVKASDIAITINGVLYTDTSISTIASMDWMTIGTYSDGTLPFNGMISNGKHYPKRLSNTELQNLTKG